MIRDHQHQSGFTLIELVVVIFILAIIAATVGLNIAKDPTSEVREEAERLAILLNVARDQAILEGRFYGVRIDEKGYEFTRLNQTGELETVVDDSLLRRREFSEDIKLADFVVDGKSVDTNDGGFLITPVGQYPAFIVSLSHFDYRWQVLSTDEGLIGTGSPDA